MSKKNFTALWRSNPWVAPYCLCKVTTKLAGSVRVYVNSLAVPQVMNFMSMHSMLVKARPIKGPILRSVLIFMGILSPSILIVHEFDLVSKSAFYQLGSWTILKQMSWYLLIQVILFEIDCAIFYTNLHELFCQFISWTNWVNSGKFMDNCWISCQVMADMKKVYDDLIIINLYLFFSISGRQLPQQLQQQQPLNQFWLLSMIPSLILVCLAITLSLPMSQSEVPIITCLWVQVTTNNRKLAKFHALIFTLSSFINH